MRILELQCIAFGSFTNVHLDFSAGEQGLHVLLGPNEAGKSTALRALQALLYGIPNHTSDNFKHKNTALRIGGRTRHSDGTELSFLRRKGYKDTLLDPDGRPIKDSSLDPFLQGVSAGFFATMFGIDHAALVEGGRAILQGEGEVGQSLFAAALGGINLRQILQNFEDEAKQLFLSRGQNPRINYALEEYNTEKRRSDEFSLPSREWSQHDQKLTQIETERQQVLQEHGRLAREKHRLERLQAALPKMAKRQELHARREALGNVVFLPPEFSDQRRGAVQELETASEAHRGASLALTQLRDDLHGLAIPERLLEQAESITALHERLGSHRKAAQDRSKLEGSRRQIDGDAQALLVELPSTLTVSGAPALRPDIAQRTRMQELGGQYQALLSSLERETEEVQQLEEQHAGTLRELRAMENPGDLTELKYALAHARRQGDLEEERAQARTSLEEEQEQAQIDLKRLGLWSGTLDDLEGMPTPSVETVEQFETHLGTLNTTKTHLGEQMQEAHDELEQLDRKHEELQWAGAVPSEEELTKMRGRRDAGWKLVRRAWVNHEDVSEDAQAYDANNHLPEAYEHSIGDADEVADRLRREADRVAQQVTLLAQRARSAAHAERLAQNKRDIERQLQHCQEEWAALWEPIGITPLSPREMRAWMSKQDKLLERAKRVREYRRTVDRRSGRINEHHRAISQALEHLGEQGMAPGDTLDATLRRSDVLVETIEDMTRHRRSLQEQVAVQQQSLERTRRAKEETAIQFAQWRTDWKAAVVGLGLSSDASPAEAHAVLTKLDERLKKVDEADALMQRIAGIERDARAFESDVKEVMEWCAPDHLTLPADHAVTHLQNSLNKARADAATKTALSRQIKEKEDVCEVASATIHRMRERLDALCRQAGCSQPDQLAALEQRSAQAQELDKECRALEEQLLEQGEGATVDQLLQEIAAVDPDALPVRLNEIACQSEDLEQQRSQLEQAIGSERTILGQMDGSAKAAEAAERAQAVLAKIHGDVHRYVRIHLASLILRREIERYRANNQGPLLSRASELFAALTAGSFSQLQTDFNEKDAPILVGVRPSGECLGVQGMSDGTRDQLYLSLRLASLEQYLTTREPLPLIVDDILINFDDQRAEATLRVLAQLSQKTQVIFFTHHGRFVELAKRVGGDEVVKIHHVGDSSVLP